MLGIENARAGSAGGCRQNRRASEALADAHHRFGVAFAGFEHRGDGYRDAGVAERDLDGWTSTDGHVGALLGIHLFVGADRDVVVQLVAELEVVVAEVRVTVSTFRILIERENLDRFAAVKQVDLSGRSGVVAADVSDVRRDRHRAGFEPFADEQGGTVLPVEVVTGVERDAAFGGHDVPRDELQVTVFGDLGPDRDVVRLSGERQSDCENCDEQDGQFHFYHLKSCLVDQDSLGVSGLIIAPYYGTCQVVLNKLNFGI